MSPLIPIFSIQLSDKILLQQLEVIMSWILINQNEI